jgi:predicted acetyltransferase
MAEHQEQEKMKIRKLFETWGMKGLKINVGFLETEWEPQAQDAEAAWEVYVELLTRIATQPLPADSGVESAALDSVYSLFGITRGVLRKYGKDCVGFAKVAVIILNQVVRPFTAHWRKLANESALEDEGQRQAFRKELAELQEKLRNYMGMRAQIAGVEDISSIVMP